MLIITELKCEYRIEPIGIDCNPRFSYILLSNQENVLQDYYHIIVKKDEEVVWNSGKCHSNNSTCIIYNGEILQPYTTYNVLVSVWCGDEKADAHTTFETGKMVSKWNAKWIGDSQVVIEDGTSPKPICFKTDFKVNNDILKARAYVTASGIYNLYLDNKKVNERYFAPGFTSYNKNLSYQTYDVTELIKKGQNQLNVIVAAGWAVGVFGFTTANHNFSDQMGLLLELHIDYRDGSKKVIKSGKDFVVCNNTKYKYADFYHGEIVDGRIDFDNYEYHDVSIIDLFPKTNICSDYGVGVKKITELKPIKMFLTPRNELVYDFGQNFSGIVRLSVFGKNGQVITVRHAEVLDSDGNFYTRNLRKAKATYQYTCTDGYQEYTPEFTYMGFRYCSVEGIENPDLTNVTGIVLSSPLEKVGTFNCSNPLINRLQENIYWSSRSNLFDIPTDCPQRDERLGWTGDIAVFSRAGTFNLDMKNFIDKWLVDLRCDQNSEGAVGHIVPYVKCIPQTIPTAGWSDAAIFVPWASYIAYGDKQVLVDNYECMKALVECEKRYAKLNSDGDEAYVFDKPFNFGDWLAPYEEGSQWMAKARELGTAYFANSVNILSKVAEILNKYEDQVKYEKLFNRICKAYKNLFITKSGELTNSYQSAYVCPMYFDMVDEIMKKKMVTFLANDIYNHNNHLTTGFLGTPFLLFALSDNGYSEKAYDLLLQETFPSWLYEVKANATTIWERWDSLRPDGLVEDNGEDINNMVSFNHYAFGSVGDFMYRRIAGIEASYLTPGYKHFTVKPVLDSRITYCNATHKTLYGNIEVSWRIEKDEFTLNVTIPVNTTATIILPNGVNSLKGSGKYQYKILIK